MQQGPRGAAQLPAVQRAARVHVGKRRSSAAVVGARLGHGRRCASCENKRKRQGALERNTEGWKKKNQSAVCVLALLIRHCSSTLGRKRDLPAWHAEQDDRSSGRPERDAWMYHVCLCVYRPSPMAGGRAVYDIARPCVLLPGLACGCQFQSCGIEPKTAAERERDKQRPHVVLSRSFSSPSASASLLLFLPLSARRTFACLTASLSLGSAHAEHAGCASSLAGGGTLGTLAVVDGPWPILALAPLTLSGDERGGAALPRRLCGAVCFFSFAL